MARRQQYPTTPIERVLLAGAILFLPLQNYFPAIHGFGFMFIYFGLIGGYVLLVRPKALSITCVHPLALATYALVGLAAILESFHPHSDYPAVFRFAQMFLGGILMATLCRDQRALRTGVYAYLATGIWVSIYVFGESYGTLSSATAVDFEEASALRMEVDKGSELQDNPNTFAFYGGQGVIVGLALALTSTKTLLRGLYFGSALLCLVGAFLNMSRGGVLIVIISGGAVLLAYGRGYARTLAIVVALLAGVSLFVPDVVFKRMVLWQEDQTALDARGGIYKPAVEHFPEYALFGIGAGNFWSEWGDGSSYWKGGRIHGSHNCFVQITIYWGLMALLGLLGVIYYVYRCLPRPFGKNALTLSLLGISVSLLLFLQVHHVVSSKQFSLGLAFVLGSACWIWPERLGHSRSRRKHPALPAKRVPAVSGYLRPASRNLYR